MIEIKVIIDELRANNSSNYKKEVLEKYKSDSLWKKFLLYTYNSNLQYYIKKGYQTDLEGTKEFDEELFQLLDSLEERKYTGNTALEKVKEKLQEYDKNTQELFDLILGRDIKCGVNVTTINKIYNDLIPTTPYMGCQSFNEKKIKKALERDGKIISEVKADGRYVNCILKSYKTDLFSRQGKPTYLTGKLIKDLERLRRIVDTDVVLMGELLVKGYDRLTGNAIVSRCITINNKIIDGANPQKYIKELEKEYNKTFKELQDLIYIKTWDIIDYKQYTKKLCNIKRIDRLNNLANLIKCFENIELIEYKICSTWNEVIQHLKDCLANGEEGTVIKSVICPWRDGKKDDQYKGKIEFQCEMKIVGFKEGTKGTKYEGTLGALILESQDGKIKCNASGLKEKKKDTDFTRDEIWNNKEEFLGKICTMKCNGLSTDKSGNKNFFYPNYVQMRDDKKEANTLEEIIEIENSILSTFKNLESKNKSKSELLDFLNS